MPIYVDEIHSDLSVLDGEFPLDEAQLERLVQLVLRRLEERERATRQHSDATALRRDSAPPLPFDE